MRLASLGAAARANIEGVTVQVPLVSGAAGLSKPVGEWSCEEVKAWIGVADGGKFAHIVLPPNMTGERAKRASLGDRRVRSSVRNCYTWILPLFSAELTYSTIFTLTRNRREINDTK